MFKKQTVKTNKIIAAIYCAFLIYLLFFSGLRHTGFDYRAYVNFVPVYNKLQIFNDSYLFEAGGPANFYLNIIGNIVIFIPFIWFLNVFGIKSPSNIRCIFTVFFTTLFVETIQYILNIGVFDIDDIILNFTGGVIGLYRFNLNFNNKSVL